MKRIFSILLFCLAFCAFDGLTQPPVGAIELDTNLLIKDPEGNEISQEQFMKLMDSGEWGIHPVMNPNGEPRYLQLFQLTEEDKRLMAEMPKMYEMPASKNIGKEIPEFQLKDINGNTISSENSKGKVLVLNFWFTACKTCIAEMPELNSVYEKYKSNPDVVFASITFNSKKEVKQFLKQNTLDYPTVVEAEKTCKDFKIEGYPTNIIVGKNGKIAQYIEGGFPKIGDVISESIDKALKEE